MKDKCISDFAVVTKEELCQLIDTYTEQQLVELGCFVWARFIDDPADHHYMSPGDIHFLMPTSWYEFVPKDFPTVLMDGTKLLWSEVKFIEDYAPYGPAYGFIKNLQNK